MLIPYKYHINTMADEGEDDDFDAVKEASYKYKAMLKKFKNCREDTFGLVY